MKKISYKLFDGTIQEIEVCDEFATSYEQLEHEESQAEERYKWHNRKHLISLDNILEAGGQIEDPSSNFFELDYEFEELHIAIAQLSAEQIWLLKKVFEKGRKNTSIAKELNVTEAAIRSQLKTIYKKIKKFYQNPSNLPSETPYK